MLKDELGQTYIYIYMHIEWKEKCDKYAIIFICKLCYKDKLGQTYICMHIGWKEKCDKYAIIFICKLLQG